MVTQVRGLYLISLLEIFSPYVIIKIREDISYMPFITVLEIIVPLGHCPLPDTYHGDTLMEQTLTHMEQYVSDPYVSWNRHILSWNINCRSESILIYIN